MSLTDDIARVEATVADASVGLPQEVFLFAGRIVPMVNVDLLIKDTSRGTLLTWRDDGNWTPGWHIPGGIIRFREPMFMRIHAVAAGELGTDVTFNPVPLTVKEFIIPELYNRSHFISLLFECTLTGEPDDKLRCRQGGPRSGEWCWHRECPENLLSVHEVYRGFM